MNYFYGLKKGLPIGLGYFSVSFGFGITAFRMGIPAIGAILISLLNLTSAGQVAGLTIITAGGTVIEMITAQLIINLRYSLMGISLTQKLSPDFSLRHRMVASFGITDENFAVASSEKQDVTPSYYYGLMTLPIIGWTLGTALGAICGEIFPADISAALGLAIYSMFVAIVIPEVRKSKGVLFGACVSVALSCILYYVPFLSKIPEGFAIIICAVIASAAAAYFMPRRDENE